MTDEQLELSRRLAAHGRWPYEWLPNLANEAQAGMLLGMLTEQLPDVVVRYRSGLPRCRVSWPDEFTGTGGTDWCDTLGEACAEALLYVWRL